MVTSCTYTATGWRHVWNFNCTWYLVARQLDDHNVIARLFHNTAFFNCNKEVEQGREEKERERGAGGEGGRGREREGESERERERERERVREEICRYT